MRESSDNGIAKVAAVFWRIYGIYWALASRDHTQQRTQPVLIPTRVKGALAACRPWPSGPAAVKQASGAPLHRHALAGLAGATGMCAASF